MYQKKYLKDILKRDANNFDLLRLIAALGVIIGHAYAINPQPPLEDGILSLLHFDFSGAMAVKFFFFLSGVLVTNSIISNPEPYAFLVKRTCRIFPGLLVYLLLTVLIIAPIFTTLSLHDYFSNSETWTFISRNLLLKDLQWRLPGLFAESKYGINGSLWTLRFEVICYIYLAIFYGLGILKNKIFTNVFFIVVVAVANLAPNYLPAPFPQNTGAQPLVGFFAIGALCANNKELISVSISRVILMWFLVIELNDSPVYEFAFYLALFYTSLFLASRNFIIRYLKIPFDASYGVYIYGFTIQQCVHGTWPNMGVHLHQLISCIIAVLIGAFSWRFVEKPFISLASRFNSNNIISFFSRRKTVKIE